MGTIIKLKRGQKSRWESLNVILHSGEPGVCFDDDDITLKIGDGVRGWNQLPTQTYTQQQLKDLIASETSGTTSGSTSESVTRISFGNIVESGNMTYPPTIITTLECSRRNRHYPDLYTKFNSIYSKFLWTVTW